MDLNLAYSQQQQLLIRDPMPAGAPLCASTVRAFDTIASSIRTFQRAQGAALGFGRVARVPATTLRDGG